MAQNEFTLDVGSHQETVGQGNLVLELTLEDGHGRAVFDTEKLSQYFANCSDRHILVRDKSGECVDIIPMGFLREDWPNWFSGTEAN